MSYPGLPHKVIACHIGPVSKPPRKVSRMSTLLGGEPNAKNAMGLFTIEGSNRCSRVMHPIRSARAHLARQVVAGNITTPRRHPGREQTPRVCPPPSQPGPPHGEPPVIAACQSMHLYFRFITYMLGPTPLGKTITQFHPKVAISRSPRRLGGYFFGDSNPPCMEAKQPSTSRWLRALCNDNVLRDHSFFFPSFNR